MKKQSGPIIVEKKLKIKWTLIQKKLKKRESK
jgi:hypothetical protein